MKIAVMQPYFFPYLGYYQLVHSVDEFVIFDDVNFIKKGYINRNSIFAHGRRLNFTIPISGASQNRKICEHRYLGEFKQFLAQVATAYRNAPFFARIYPIIEAVALSGDLSVSAKNTESIRAVFDYLGLSPTLSFASEHRIAGEIRAQERIIEICRRKGATRYHNAIGGRGLYQSEAFAAHGIDLKFVEMQEVQYPHAAYPSEPCLSIIDVLMWNEKDDIVTMLNAFRLV